MNVPVSVLLARLSRTLETSRILLESENVSRADVLDYLKVSQDLVRQIQEAE